MARKIQRVAIFTLTMNRLEYTKHCFKTLKEKAGVEYDHFVIDNGSTDGTIDWLREHQDEFKKVIFNKENVGIGVASNQALEVIFCDNYDLIIKFDNDCEVISENIIGQMIEICDDMPIYSSRYILSPKVEGINNQPKRKSYTMVSGRRIGITSMVGGLFMVTPAKIMRDFKFREDRKRIGFDSHLCDFARRNGAQTGYVEGLKVNHYETTDGQAKRFPEYFSKKSKETHKELGNEPK